MAGPGALAVHRHRPEVDRPRPRRRPRALVVSVSGGQGHHADDVGEREGHSREEVGHTDTYRFDLVNVARQVLSNHAAVLHGKIVEAHRYMESNQQKGKIVVSV